MNNIEEDNKIITTSEGFQTSYMDIKSNSEKMKTLIFIIIIQMKMIIK